MHWASLTARATVISPVLSQSDTTSGLTRIFCASSPWEISLRSRAHRNTCGSNLIGTLRAAIVPPNNTVAEKKIAEMYLKLPSVVP